MIIMNFPPKSFKPWVNVPPDAVVGWFEVLLRLEFLISWRSSVHQVLKTPSFFPILMSYQLTLKPLKVMKGHPRA